MSAETENWFILPVFAALEKSASDGCDLYILLRQYLIHRASSVSTLHNLNTGVKIPRPESSALNTLVVSIGDIENAIYDANSCQDNLTGLLAASTQAIQQFEASNYKQDPEVSTKDFIMPWMRACHHSLNGGDHLNCATRNGVVRLLAIRDTSPLPSRVIDVGLDAEKPRLHVTGNSSFKSDTLRRRHQGFRRESSEDDEDGDHEYRPSNFGDEEKDHEKELAKYLILSDCWGKNNTALTTKANISQRQDGIDLEYLPKTIRDATQITRSMGERYLFVDALCVIQPTDGDTTDWQAETSHMGAYYENALCTIAATGASGSKDGCLFESPGPRFPSVPCYLPPWTKSGTSQTKCINPSIPLWWLCVIDAPLYQRGWTVQERAMSRRTLHFTKDTLHFECAGLRASEYRPSGLHEEEARAIHENLGKKMHRSLGRMRKSSRSQILG